jgi:hypothetical protein
MMRVSGMTLLGLVLSVSGIALLQSAAKAGNSTSLDTIQAELHASISVNSLPKNVSPPASRWSALWSDDFGAVATGGGNSTCWDQAKSSSSLPTCIYGDRSAKRTLVLTGDSQAWMWEPAFDQWGLSSKWRVVVLAKGACPPWPDTQQEYVNSSAFPACAVFQSRVAKFINTTHPSVVVAAGLRPMIPTLTVSRVDSDVKRFVSSISPSRARVLIVGPSPSFYAYDYLAHSTLSAPNCLASHSNELQLCDGIAKKQLLDYFMNIVINETQLPGTSKLLNLTQLLCSGECPMLAKGILVYIDSDHVSYDWAVHVSGALGDVLAPELNGL